MFPRKSVSPAAPQRRKIRWLTTGTGEPGDLAPTYLVGEAKEPVALPIRVKTMKRRTVRVAVHKIASVVPGRPDDPPDLMPTDADLTAKLDETFGRQLNAWFEVDMLPQENFWQIAA